MRVVLKALGVIALILGVALPAIIFPQHRLLATTGQYRVANVTYTYTDTSRLETYTDTGENRNLNVEFWYPESCDEAILNLCPLIVFSHGSTGIRSSNESLYNELASHGYVVCSIDHTYQCLYTTDENGHTTWIDMGFVKEIKADDAKSDKQRSYEHYRKWMEVRTGDIDFVINTILAKARKNTGETVYRLVNDERIGVIGHSLGGSAALGIGRMRGDVGAVIALESPFMCDIKGVEDGEFVWNKEAYPVPVLNIYSDSSWSHLDEWAQYAKNYELLSGTEATAFNIHIDGVGHFTLTDLALTSPLLTRVFNGRKSTTDTRYCLETLNKVCLRFFNCYLKGQGEFVPDEMY